MSNDLLLVGSVPLETVEEVILTFGLPLGPHLNSMPDGEVGTRTWWTARLAFEVFNGHPELDVLNRPAPDNGVERLFPRNLTDRWQFKVKDGVAAVRFGNVGWRLGFAKDAITSYFIFRKLKEDGVIPPSVRFQISMPLVNSTITNGIFPIAGDLEKIKPGYEAALAAEIGTIVRKLPADDIALQWDCSWEVTDVYGAIKGMDPHGAIERNVGQISRLSRIVPENIQLGIHLCFGTFGGWPRFSPDNLGAAVNLANAAIAQAGRRLDWIHIPTLNTTSEAFYEPLKNLRASDTRVYLGLIHNMDTFEKRLNVARKYLPDFGVAAFCGFGREPVSSLPSVVQDHLKAVDIMNTHVDRLSPRSAADAS
jgi:hypothetical protein